MISVCLAEMVHGLRVRTAGDQLLAVGEAFRSAGKALDQAGTQISDAFPDFRIADAVGQFVGVACQVKVLFQSGNREPDVLVSPGDDPVVGELPVGVLSVEPGPHGSLRIPGQGQKVVSVYRIRDRRACQGQ